MLNAIQASGSIIELKLTDIPIQIDYRLDRLKSFLQSRSNIRVLILKSNKFTNLDFLNTICRNKTILELHLIDQKLEQPASTSMDAASGSADPAGASRRKESADSDDVEDDKA
jgi:hypothetical protein